ncbi:MAG: hypothetical protein JWP73_100 [Phenylobacterium sp.]|nr:hypothetical protein [Phenylobacterium sp.]
MGGVKGDVGVGDTDVSFSFDAVPGNSVAASIENVTQSGTTSLSLGTGEVR